MALVAVGAFWGSKRNWKTTFLATLVFHLHLLCDVIGSRGVDQLSMADLVPAAVLEHMAGEQSELET